MQNKPTFRNKVSAANTTTVSNFGEKTQQATFVEK
jgi:hypothetical protein